MTTCERDRVLSHFAVHVSPIYYLFLPFYALFPLPVTLEVLQALLLASGGSSRSGALRGGTVCPV